MSAPGPQPQPGVRAVTLRTDSRLANVELVACAVRGLCGAAGMTGRNCARVELALVEAVNNVVRHSYHGRPGGLVEVVFVAEAGRVSLEVADEGDPMPPRTAPPFDFDPNDLANLPEGGMGLFLIHSVMDSVEYHSRGGRNALVMTRRIAA